MDNSKKMLIARAKDLFRACDRQATARFSNFLDGAEQAILESELRFFAGYNIAFFGGYDDAERKIFGVFPEWEEADNEQFPISVLKVTSGFGKKLTHRDYLGTVLGQGIDRNKTGDIIVDGDVAYIFVCEDISSYLANNIKKIGNQGVKIEVCSVNDVTLPESERLEIKTVCASERVDAVVAALCNISRADSAKLIKSEYVKLNHIECVDVSRTVKPNDLISVRGYGRFVFLTADGETRKGRLHITAQKYV